MEIKHPFSKMQHITVFISILNEVIIFAHAQQGIFEVSRMSHIYENVGFTATLECDIDGSEYANSDYVGWSKKLLPNDTQDFNEGDAAIVSTDELLVATFDDVREPYLMTGRYKVSTPPPRTYSRATLRSVLTIKDLRPEDSGKYVCYIRSSVFRKAQIKLLNVLSPVDHVNIKGPRDSMKVANVKRTEKPTLSYVAGQPSYVECQTVGGNPRPEIRAFVGDRQIGMSSTSTASETVAGHTKGLQWRNFTVIRHISSFVPLADDNGKELRCEGHVPHGVVVKTEKEKLNIYWLPIFLQDFCDTTQFAEIGDKNVDMPCQFRSQPPFTSVTWFAMKSGQTVRAGKIEFESLRAFLYLVKESDGVFSATLRIREVGGNSFQKYRLTIVNRLGTVSTMIELKRGSPQTEQ